MHIMHYRVNTFYARHAFATSARFMHNVTMNLANIRKAKGLNQADLADMIGVNQSTVQRAEQCHPSAKLATYKQVARVLDVTLCDIFSDDRTALEIALLQRLRKASPSSLARFEMLLDVVLLESDEDQDAQEAS